MGGERAAPSRCELEPVGRIPDVRVAIPKAEPPAVVVTAYHQDGRAPIQRSQRRRHPESVAGQDASVRKPELEQIAVHEQRVGEGRHKVEKFEERGFGRRWGVSEVGIGDDDESLSWHGPKHAEVEMGEQPASEPICDVMVRVNYSETDQMGVAYHARYLVWLDVARCEYLRQTGLSYRELEASGLRLVVGEAAIRYRRPAHYDDLLRVRCWVRDVASRRIVFGYAVEHAETGRLLATATVALHPLDSAMALCRLPSDVARRLVPIPDPVRS